MLSRLFIAALRSPEGKGLTSWLLFVMFFCDFVTFPFGNLRQVWYLIVSIADPCCLSYCYITQTIVHNPIKPKDCVKEWMDSQKYVEENVPEET